MQLLYTLGLNTGSAGNASCRLSGKQYLITPSGIDPSALSPDSIVRMPASGANNVGELKPSSEANMHGAIYAARPDVGAIVHTHSPYATALACTRQPIPAFHYMVGVAGGDSIRCAPYATFGSEELSENAVVALRERKACLLANHGVLAVAADPLAAAMLALEVEQLSMQYCIAVQSGGPVLLDGAQMKEVLEKFKTYGQISE
ncbi:MAG TPA: class II aldolase [Gammaproteobacteria bacterium]|nr:class II aldolase [Gammaproteobacteria bacterium]